MLYVLQLTRLFLVAAIAFPTAAQNVILSHAGGDWSYPFAGKPAAQSPLGLMYGLATDSRGTLYLADVQNHRVFRRNASGLLEIVAGNGIPGYSGDGGDARNASLNGPAGLAFDSQGNLYVADSTNHVVRRVTSAGVITTFAGTGLQGFSGDGGEATRATLNSPTSLATDSAGNLYIADYLNYRIRVVSSDGGMRTFAGIGTPGFSGDGGPAAQAAITPLYGMVVDGRGRLLFADNRSNRIRAIENGVISTFVGNGSPGAAQEGAITTASPLEGASGLALDPEGRLLFTDSARVFRVVENRLVVIAGNGEYAYAGDGLPATRASLSSPIALAADRSGSFYASDELCLCVRGVNPAGIISTVAGNGQFGRVPEDTPANRTFLFSPLGLAFDAAGNLLVANSELFQVAAFTPDGRFRNVAGRQLGCCGDGGPAREALLDFPAAIAVDARNRIFFSETGSDLIRMIDTNGVISTFAGRRYSAGFNGDRARLETQFNNPSGIAFDTAGNLYVADRTNRRVRRIGATDGNVVTIAGTGDDRSSGDGGPASQSGLRRPVAVAFRGTDLLIADTDAHRVRIVSGGSIRTFAGNGEAKSAGDGGPATAASLNGPSGLAVDAAGNVFVLEEDGVRVRRIDASGNITTIAGSDTEGFLGDGGPATQARLRGPRLGIAVDRAGNVYFSDTANNRIRVIRAAPPRLSVEPATLSLRANAGGLSAPSALTVRGDVVGVQVQAAVASGQDWVQLSTGAATTPLTIEIQGDATRLAPGTYQGSVEIRSAVSLPPVTRVPIQFIVSESLPPRLSVPESPLQFEAEAGQSSQQSLAVSNTGGGTLTVNLEVVAGTGGSWLQLSSEPVAIPEGATVTVPLVAMAADLAPGLYSAAVRIEGAGQVATLPATFLVKESPQPRLLLSQTGLSFQAVAGGGQPAPQILSVLNAGGNSMTWSVRTSTLAGGDWLQVTPSSGTVEQPLLDIAALTVTVKPDGLAPGPYYGRIEVTAPSDNSPQFATIVLQVLPPDAEPPPEVLPSGLVFAGREGENPGSQSVTVTNLIPRGVQFVSSRLTLDGVSWFTHSPANAAVQTGDPVSIAVQPEHRSLAPGVRRGLLTLLFDDGSSRSISLLSVVAQGQTLGDAQKHGERGLAGCPSPDLNVEYTSLRNEFVAAAGEPLTLQVRVVDPCGNFLTPQIARGAKVIASFSNGDPQTELVHVGQGNWSGTWKPVRVTESRVIITVLAIATEGSRTQASGKQIQGVVRTGGRTPMIQAGALRHSASFETGVPVAPGQLISVLGAYLADSENRIEQPPLPSELGTTEVLLGGRPLPLLYTSDGQLNAQVPYGLPVNTVQQVLVRRGSALSVPEQFVVSASQPGIFTVNEAGFGQGTILKQKDLTLAGPQSPAERGEEVVILCTGLGEVDPAVPAGVAASEPAPNVIATVEVQIDGKPAQVVSATLSPGFAGRYEVRAIVPADAAAGDQVEVIVISGGRSSKPVTMAIR